MDNCFFFVFLYASLLIVFNISDVCLMLVRVILVVTVSVCVQQWQPMPISVPWVVFPFTGGMKIYVVSRSSSLDIFDSAKLSCEFRIKLSRFNSIRTGLILTLLQLYTVVIYNLKMCMKEDNPSQKTIMGDNLSQKNIKGDNSRKIIICMEQQVIFYMANSSDIILNVLCIF